MRPFFKEVKVTDNKYLNTNALIEVVDHPLVQHKLTLIRDQRTGSSEFRQLVREISLLLAYEVCRDLEVEEVQIATPFETMVSSKLEGKKLCLVSILRAGNGLLDGMLDLIPAAKVGHIGLYRDPETKVAIEYYIKLPAQIEERLCIVVDPMLATGGSATAALKAITTWGVPRTQLISVIAAPEGIEEVRRCFPETAIYVAAVDRELNQQKFIVPGLGDAGDRIFNTPAPS